MTGTDPKSRRHVIEQHNHGDGAFVGGDNHGEIRIEAVDAMTKGLLRDISEKSPELARLLEEAMDDGLISADTAGLLAAVARSINEDVAEMLMSAARSINEDVAGLLMHASHSINEDVAGLLTRASQSINEDVAGQISHAAETFDKASRRLDLDEFKKTVIRAEKAVSSASGTVDLEGLVVRLEGGLSSLESTGQRNGEPPEQGQPSRANRGDRQIVEQCGWPDRGYRDAASPRGPPRSQGANRRIPLGARNRRVLHLLLG
ncbi:hypothetical protein ACFYRL_11300 [Streptomyces goshikiensis]|uniref:hypothetical protein n=1 Tax=Streptomyces goshikiensis TaxID=1942 RepID=UPI00369FF281